MKPQDGQAVCVLHSRKPDVRQRRSGRNSMRLGQAKDRSIQKYLETSSKHSVLVQCEALLSGKRIAV